jgi:SNF2 family DNA or RNA helicase
MTDEPKPKVIGLSLHEGGEHAVIKPLSYLGDSFNAYRGAIEGAIFDRATSTNVAGMDKVPTILKSLREGDFDVEVTPELAERLKKHTVQLWSDLQGSTERADAVDAELKKKGLYLFPFQRIGVRWLATQYGALLADEMGLGKTIQALAALPPSTGVLVVAPAVVKGVWKREIARWRPHLEVTIIQGRGNFRWPEPGEVVIINYDILPDMHEPASTVNGKKRGGCKDKLCKGCGPGKAVIASTPKDVVAIVDEAHMLKSNKAARTLKFRALSEGIRARRGRVWLLTATPLLNRPQELWSIYQAAGIAQQAFGSWNQFVKLFNGMPAHWGGFDWGTPEAEVSDRIRRVCMRRLRTDVLPELPVKTWRRLDVEVNEKALRACDKVLKEYGGIKKILHLIENEGLKFETMSSVRHALAVAKIPSLLSLIEQYEEQEEPLVVFSAHRAVVEELSKREGWAVILGGVKAEDRTRIEDDFQAGKLKGIAATIAAGGVGITLTRSHNAIFTDLEWTPALNAQAEDRICRIGQTRGCIITILQAEHELDERITELLMRKQRLITETVDEARAPVSMTEGTRDAEIAAMMKAADEELARASASKPEPETIQKPNGKWRMPQTPQEEWGMEALKTLAMLDPDRASEENEVGFNSADGVVGHSLAGQLTAKGGLTNAQWSLVVRLCKKYHRQVGRCPGDEDENAA